MTTGPRVSPRDPIIVWVVDPLSPVTRRDVGAVRDTALAVHGEIPIEVVVTGEVLEADPPRRLVQTWAPVWIEDEEPGTITWDIEPSAHGSVRLTLTHDLTGRPTTAEQVAGNPDPTNEGGGGWPWVLSGIKTVLETGEAMEPSAADGAA